GLDDHVVISLFDLFVDAAAQRRLLRRFLSEYLDVDAAAADVSCISRFFATNRDDGCFADRERAMAAHAMRIAARDRRGVSPVRAREVHARLATAIEHRAQRTCLFAGRDVGAVENWQIGNCFVAAIQAREIAQWERMTRGLARDRGHLRDGLTREGSLG